MCPACRYAYLFGELPIGLEARGAMLVRLKQTKVQERREGSARSDNWRTTDLVGPPRFDFASLAARGRAHDARPLSTSVVRQQVRGRCIRRRMLEVSQLLLARAYPQP